MANLNELTEQQQQILLNVMNMPAEQRCEFFRQIAMEKTFPPEVRDIALTAFLEGSAEVIDA